MLDEEAGGKQFSTNGGWLGFTDHFWLTALAPANGRFTGSFRKAPTGAYQADFSDSPVVVAPGKAGTTETRLVAGA